MGLPEVPLGLDVEEHSPSDWTWIFKLEVRMCFRLLELHPPPPPIPLVFPVVLNKIRIPRSLFSNGSKARMYL